MNDSDILEVMGWMDVTMLRAGYGHTHSSRHADSDSNGKGTLSHNRLLTGKVIKLFYIRTSHGCTEGQH
ncbi:MAG: hypothetical protein V3T49_01340 [Dehalococcoidia bacterium]